MHDMMQTILYISLYPESNKERAAELAHCLEQNCLSGFDVITVLWEGVLTGESTEVFDHCTQVANKWGTELVIFYSVKPLDEQRPTLNDFIFRAKGAADNTLHIIANSDIIIPIPALHQLRNLPWEQKLYVALSRWDIGNEGTLQLLDRPDSADVFAWYGRPEIEGCDCSPGFPGFDNRVAYEFKKAGYKVVNPSREIITKHLHLVKKNNYRENGKADGAVIASQICPEPYAFHPPIHISQI